MPVEVVADSHSGVVDFRMEPAPGAAVTAYSRVVPAGEGAVYAFTQVQPAGMPDEMFAAQVRALGHELVALKAVLEVECPIGR